MIPTKRRGFLRALGGFGLALPFLELYQPKRAEAGGPVRRFVNAFGGTSLGLDGGSSVIPLAEGALSENLTLGLQPLGDLGVTDYVSVVSGLKIPWGDTPPPGGRPPNWHSMTPCPLSCGMAGNLNEDIRGPTADWVAYDAIGKGTKLDVLAYRVQAAFYRSDAETGGVRGIYSARMNGDNLEQVTPISSPRLAYQSLFNGFIPPDPAEAAEALALLARRKSIVDLVATDAGALLKRLGQADKLRMQRHFDELRSLEERLNALELPAGGNCFQLPDPGDDPPIGEEVENGQQGESGAYSGTQAWSDEEKRAQVMVDLVAMAFACDLSRAVSLMFTFSQCFMNMNQISGAPSDLHEMSHGSQGNGQVGQDALALGVAWHVKHWGTLIKKLSETEDLDGSKVIDNTALCLAFEGGLGYDPEQDLTGSPHSSENMIMLIGGKVGGLNAQGGRHLQAFEHHPVEVINTAFKAVGMSQTLGEVEGTIDELIG